MSRSSVFNCGAFFALFFWPIFLTGCGSYRETLPDRSAKEQMILSGAIDRAVTAFEGDKVCGKKVYVDADNLDAYDSAYLLQRVRQQVLDAGAILTDNLESADIALEIASGAASLDRREYLLGLPEFPLPVPFAGETLLFPELRLFKYLEHTGRAKLLFSAVCAHTGKQAFKTPLSYGRARERQWWFLLLGPVRSVDVPGMK